MSDTLESLRARAEAAEARIAVLEGEVNAAVGRAYNAGRQAVGAQVAALRRALADAIKMAGALERDAVCLTTKGGRDHIAVFSLANEFLLSWSGVLYKTDATARAHDARIRAEAFREAADACRATGYPNAEFFEEEFLEHAAAIEKGES